MIGDCIHCTVIGDCVALFLCVCVCGCLYVQSMEEEFVKWMDWYGKSYGEFELIKGDFLDPSFDEILQSAT